MKPVGVALSQLDQSLPIGPRAGVIYYRLLMYTVIHTAVLQRTIEPHTSNVRSWIFMTIFVLALAGIAVIVNSIMKRNTHIQSLPFV
jgi:hypothetical protein